MEIYRKVSGFGLRRTFIIVLVLLFCVAAFSCSREKRTAENRSASSALAGSAAPDFRLRDLQGRNVALSHYRGKVVLLEFWATWCPPCRATVPELVNLQKEFKGRDFAVLGVSLDDHEQNLQKELTDFSRKFHINYPVLLGDEAVEHDYGVWSIPRSFLIDKEGKIRQSYSGYIDQYQSKVSAEIERLL
jgi:peroxiredoxin